jgi:hypothetical protein
VGDLGYELPINLAGDHVSTSPVPLIQESVKEVANLDPIRMRA